MVSIAALHLHSLIVFACICIFLRKWWAKMLFHVISLFIDSQRSYTYIFFLLSHIRRYSWKTTEWTECKVDMLLSQQDRRRGNHTGMCGGGTQTREVYCVQASTDTPSNLSPLRSKEGNFSSLIILTRTDFKGKTSKQQRNRMNEKYLSEWQHCVLLEVLLRLRKHFVL